MGELNSVLHQPQRLRIIALLHRNRQAAFTTLRDGLAITPGNLQSHLARLEQAGYLSSARVLVDTHFEMRYRITPAGSAAFASYCDTLREILAAQPDEAAE